MKRCLIADASEAVRKVARHYLEAQGLEVFEAENGEAALTLLRQKGCDVMLLDWHLPGTTTVELMSGLRFQVAQRRPVVIYWTTDNDEADISRAMAAGCDTHMLKPFNQRDLVDKFQALGFAA